MVRAHILFSGNVQGVGFRYTTMAFARRLDLYGWVKNLPDGDVEAAIEGPRETIEELLSQLNDEFRSFIKDRQIDWQETRGEFKSFSIA